MSWFFPRKFIFEGEWWKVRMKKALSYQRKPIDGLTTPWKRLIQINSSLPEEKRFHAYFHEYLHVILDDTKLTANHDGPLTWEQEEQIVMALESKLLSAFKIEWKKDGQ